MKFPSVKYLAAQAGVSARRFYLPLLFAFTGTYTGLLLITNYQSESLYRILFTCMLGMPLSLGCLLYSERHESRRLELLMPVLVIVFSLCYWRWLAPGMLFEHPRLRLIFFVLAICMHLWVAVAPYIRHSEKTGFWRFNELLYTRMVLAFVFSAALFLGLLLALQACKILLRFDIDSDMFVRLWVLVAGVFNTWFFLAGVPDDYAAIDTQKAFPKYLKIFTQYILIPIVSLYMVILYMYGFKIIAQWSLPKGWVSMLIFCYSVLGILAILLTNPLREDKDSAWVRMFSKTFFIASLPLVVLLYTAIWERVRHYGITEQRYYLILLGGWLGIVSLYFIFSAAKNIKVIPLSLVIIGLLSLFGPWNVFSVLERSQLHRLEKILVKYNIWKPGEKVSASHKEITDNYDAEQLKDIIDYFVDGDNRKAMQYIFAMDLNAFPKRTAANDWEAKNYIKDSLTHILCSNEINGMTTYRRDLEFTTDMHTGMDVSGYSKEFEYEMVTYQDKKHWVFLSPADSVCMEMVQQDSTAQLRFLRDGKQAAQVDLTGLIKHLESRESETGVTQKEMTIDGGGTFMPRVIIKEISIKHPATIDNDYRIIRAFKAQILIR